MYIYTCYWVKKTKTKKQQTNKPPSFSFFIKLSFLCLKSSVPTSDLQTPLLGWIVSCVCFNALKCLKLVEFVSISAVSHVNKISLHLKILLCAPGVKWACIYALFFPFLVQLHHILLLPHHTLLLSFPLITLCHLRFLIQCVIRGGITIASPQTTAGSALICSQHLDGKVHVMTGSVI